MSDKPKPYPLENIPEDLNNLTKELKKLSDQLKGNSPNAIHAELDEAGVPKVIEGEQSTLLDRVTWLIKAYANLQELNDNLARENQVFAEDLRTYFAEVAELKTRLANEKE